VSILVITDLCEVLSEADKQNDQQTK